MHPLGDWQQQFDPDEPEYMKNRGKAGKSPRKNNLANKALELGALSTRQSKLKIQGQLTTARNKLIGTLYHIISMFPISCSG